MFKDRMRLRFEQAFPECADNAAEYHLFRYHMGIGGIIVENPLFPGLQEKAFRRMEVDAFRFLLRRIKEN
jgi:hypothetical protein